MAWRHDTALTRAWWERMLTMTQAAETPSKPAIFCAVCRAVQRHRADKHRTRLRVAPRPSD
eukprot:2948927-Prymnesium_polylepis.1